MMTMSKKDDRPRHQKSMFFITNKRPGLSLDLQKKALKCPLQNIYSMLDLLYHKCNPLFTTIVEGSIFLKIFFKTIT